MAGPPDAHPDEILDIPSRDRDRTIRIHIYRPASSEQPSPVLVNYHGGGFMLPRHGEDDEYCRHISNESKHTVIDCSYRLAPEHPYPAALHDVEDAIKYILSKPERFDLSRLNISGFSAGGNLALVAASTLFPETFQSAVTFYPCTDFAIDPSTKTHGPDASVTSALRPFGFRFILDCYTYASGARAQDPTVSPAFAVLENFPPRVMIVTAARDSLCPEAESLGAALAGVRDHEVSFLRIEGCDHAFDKRPPKGSLRESAKNEAYSKVVEFLLEN